MNTFARLGLLGVLLTGGLTLSGCDLNYDNPNAATVETAVRDVNGLRALAVGMRRTYSIQGLSIHVRSSALLTREFAVVLGFTDPQDLEEGGPNLPLPENGYVLGIWQNHYRVIDMANQIIANVGNVSDAPTRNALLATAHFYKAASYGNLAQFFERFPLETTGSGAFVTRESGLQEAVRLLTEALAALGNAEPSNDFKSRVFGTPNFNLTQSLNAYVARFSLMLGQNAEAAAAAGRALNNVGLISVFPYDNSAGNENPIFVQTVREPAALRPVDNFGINPAEYTVPDTDGRKAFYLAPRNDIGVKSGLPVETMRGFFDADNKAIPVFLPGEMYLIRAEAFARLNRPADAVAEIDRVRTKTNDPFGVNAGLPAYSGGTSQAELLQEIYLQRRVELFLTGLSLEDSRRLGRPAPATPPSYQSFNRTRNFLPYPDSERNNNPNTPANPNL